MATQRPLKEGNVRTYQEKVGLGYFDILAGEVDADLDTIYSAWNAGGAPAGPAGGDLAGVYPNPAVVKSAGPFTATGTITASNGSLLLAPKGHLYSDANWTTLLRNDSASPGYDDTKVGWRFTLDTQTAGSDQAFLARTAVGGAVTYPFVLNGPTGDASVTGRSIHKNYAGGIYGANTPASGASNAPATLNTAWFASALNYPQFNQIIFDRDGLAMIWALYNFTPAASGFGVALSINQYNGAGFATVVSRATRTETWIEATAIVPLWNASYRTITVGLTNATGAAIASGTCFLSGFYLGGF